MAKRKKTISTKIQLLVATGIVMLLSAFGLFVGWLDSNMDTTPDTDESVTLHDITLKGYSVCLGKKGENPTTMECGLGIKTPGGSVYLVKGESRTALDPDNEVAEVTGTLTIPGDPDYKSDGTLTVKK